MDKTDIIRNIKKKKYIAGILQIHSQYKFGYSKSGNPKYPFTPFEENLPLFLVSSNCVKKLKPDEKKKNQYVLIHYLDWKGKYPRGACDKVFGSVDSLQAIYECLPYSNSLVTIHPKLKTKDSKKKLSKLQINNLIERVITETDTSGYNRLSKDLTIISVDPIGCIDIDDALSIERLGDVGIRVGVHIADTTLILNAIHNQFPEWELYDRIVNSLQTVYTPLTQYTMLPENVAFNYASLREGEERFSITVWLIYNFNDDKSLDFCYEDSCVERTIIVNKKAMSYEMVNSLYQNRKTVKTLSGLGETVEKLMEVSVLTAEKLLPNLWQKNSKSWDSHNMIETFMIMANQFIGNRLKEQRIENIVYRVHPEPLSTVHEKPFVEDKIRDPSLLSFLNILHSSAAEYTIGDSDKSYYHYGLQLENYTHFTSPIRRWADTYIHLLVKKYLLDDKIIQPSIDYFNDEILVKCISKSTEKQNEVKRMERMFHRLQLVEKVEKAYDSYTTNAIIFGFSQDNPFKLILYLLDEKLLFSIYVIHRKIQELYDWVITKDKNSVQIIQKDSKAVTSYQIYQTISIQVISRINKDRLWDKLVVRII